MTFTERNLPPPEPSGETIRDGIRVSLLAWLEQHGFASAQELWSVFCQREGYGTFEEIADDITRRFGPDAGGHFTSCMQAHFKRQEKRMVWSPGHDYEAEPALRALPTAQFLDVLELAIASAQYSRWEAVEEINRLFAKRGVYFRFDEETGLAEWHGDQGLHEVVVQPAIECLNDSRLAGARSEFEAALAHMRSGGMKDREDAIDEAAKSVESVMKVLASEQGIKLTGKETARPLFEAISRAGVVAAEVDNAVLAASRVRNSYGGHGSGAQPRQIAPEMAELAIRSAATAINHLAAMLP